MKVLNKILNHTEEILVSSGILFAALLLFVNVVLRYIFKYGIVWAEELTRYIIVWVTFVGGAICVRRGSHLTVSILLEFVKGAKRKAIIIGAHLLTILFTLFLTIYGFELVSQAFVNGQVTPALQAPYYFIYLAIPIGGALMTLRLIQDIVSGLKDSENDESPSIEEVK
ncbi:MAG TPA: TRAP transporter small permease [Clostridia bacterium]|nr:TRAP transporter small permease [Clostridia bacterium]